MRLPKTPSRSIGTKRKPGVIEKLRAAIQRRGGSSGIKALGRTLRIMDDSGDKYLDKNELKYGLADYGLRLSSSEIGDILHIWMLTRVERLVSTSFCGDLRRP